MIESTPHAPDPHRSNRLCATAARRLSTSHGQASPLTRVQIVRPVRRNHLVSTVSSFCVMMVDSGGAGSRAQEPCGSPWLYEFNTRTMCWKFRVESHSSRDAWRRSASTDISSSFPRQFDESLQEPRQSTHSCGRTARLGPARAGLRFFPDRAVRRRFGARCLRTSLIDQRIPIAARYRPSSDRLIDLPFPRSRAASARRRSPAGALSAPRSRRSIQRNYDRDSDHPPQPAPAPTDVKAAVRSATSTASSRWRRWTGTTARPAPAGTQVGQRHHPRAVGLRVSPRRRRTLSGSCHSLMDLAGPASRGPTWRRRRTTHSQRRPTRRTGGPSRRTHTRACGNPVHAFHVPADLSPRTRSSIEIDSSPYQISPNVHQIPTALPPTARRPTQTDPSAPEHGETDADDAAQTNLLRPCRSTFHSASAQRTGPPRQNVPEHVQAAADLRLPRSAHRS